MSNSLALCLEVRDDLRLPGTYQHIGCRSMAKLKEPLGPFLLGYGIVGACQPGGRQFLQAWYHLNAFDFSVDGTHRMRV